MSLYKVLENNAYEHIAKEPNSFKYYIDQFNKDLKRFPDWIVNAFHQGFKQFSNNNIIVNYYLANLLALWVEGIIIYAIFELPRGAFSNKELKENQILSKFLTTQYFNIDDETIYDGNKIFINNEISNRVQYPIKEINITCHAAETGDGNATLNQYIGMYNNKNICDTGINKPELYKIKDGFNSAQVEIGFTNSYTTFYHLYSGMGCLLRIPYDDYHAYLLYNKNNQVKSWENLSNIPNINKSILDKEGE